MSMYSIEDLVELSVITVSEAPLDRQVFGEKYLFQSLQSSRSVRLQLHYIQSSQRAKKARLSVCHSRKQVA